MTSDFDPGLGVMARQEALRVVPIGWIDLEEEKTMTTEPPATPDPTPAPEPPAPQAGTASPWSNMSGQTMVMIAGILVVAVFLIFGLIADEWYPPFGSIVVGSFAILIPLTKVESVGSGLSAATLLIVIGYWLAVAGAWDFIGDITFGWDGPEEVIASLILAAAAVVAFLGARAIKA